MSEQWDGRGLPPVAAERVRRAAAGGPWTSMLPVPSAAGLASTEYEPVGEVMGSIVQNVGWAGYGGCGGFTGGILGGIAGPMAPMPAFRPYREALEHGYGTALHRMRLEAAAIGADGIVGVVLTADHLDQGSREFIALGTAVRSRGTAPPKTFTTSLAGQDVAKLLGAGWLPAEIVYGIAISIRHDDWTTRQQASWGGGNTEVSGYTELATAVRADARHRFAHQITRAGGQGAIVSDMRVRMWHVEPAENHRDHVAEASVVGDALVAVERPTPRAAAPLTVMPLRPRGGLS